MNSNDFLTLYVTIELQSFSLYILSTLNKDSINSASAGLKYFLIGSLASAFILLGIAFIYLLTGLTNFESLYVFLNITDFISSSVFMPTF
jgi:NADH-ubiquinone oxidoreductase chain 2